VLLIPQTDWQAHGAGTRRWHPTLRLAAGAEPPSTTCRQLTAPLGMRELESLPISM